MPAPARLPAETYLLQIRLILDPHHALGFDANLSDLGQPLQVFSNFLDSVTVSVPAMRRPMTPINAR